MTAPTVIPMKFIMEWVDMQLSTSNIAEAVAGPY